MDCTRNDRAVDDCEHRLRTLQYIDLYDVAVYQFTGYDTNNPIGSTASGFVLGGDGPATITLSAASVSSSYLLASAVGASGSSSPYSAAAGSGWTELRDVYPGQGYL